jgi:hypothetical protein
LPPNFDYYNRERILSLSSEELERKLLKAQKIASSVGLNVDWNKAGSCSHCRYNLVDIICELRDKGAVFRALSEAPMSVWANCNGELSGQAAYGGKLYGVTQRLVYEIETPCSD